mmetsp:Transcript_24183/g.77636  ORF Transcript_24183/g.77636 Transcript_24183/m.77636 type:complete len:379 (+) Transcript_24183:226-1362(+)
MWHTVDVAGDRVADASGLCGPRDVHPSFSSHPLLTFLRADRLHLLESVLDVRQNVRFVLDAHRQTDQRVADSQLGPLLGRHRRVRHDGRRLRQRLHSAQRLGQGEQLHILQERARAFQAALHVERDHASEPAHLGLGDLVLRVAWQARVDHALHRLVALQVRGHRLSVRLVLAHTHGQRLESTKGHVAVEWRRDSAHAVLNESQTLDQLVRVRHRDTHHHITVASDELGHRVHHDVRTQVQRALEVGRHEGVVHHNQQVVLMGRLGHCLDVSDLERRVGWRLQPHQLGLGRHCRLQRRRVTQIHEGEVNVVRRFAHTAEVALRPAIHVVDADDMVTRVEEVHDGARGGQTRRPRAAMAAILHSSDALLKRRARRVAGA